MRSMFCDFFCVYIYGKNIKVVYIHWSRNFAKNCCTKAFISRFVMIIFYSINVYTFDPSFLKGTSYKILKGIILTKKEK